MKSGEEGKFTVGLDIGTTHVTVVAAEIETCRESVNSTVSAQPYPIPRIHVLGAARAANSGMKKGSMVSMDAVTSSIHEAVDEVERQTGVEISSVRVAVANPSAHSDNCTETLALRGNEVKAADLMRLSHQVTGQKPPQGFDFIHLIPGQYLVDSKAGIVNPEGLWGNNLALLYHRVLFPQADLHNAIRACNNAGLRVKGVAFEALAASQAVLDPDEKELGTLCISLGASLTHVALYSGGIPLICKDYPIGAHHITKDLSIGLRTTQSEAERVKREVGQALYNQRDATEEVQLLTIDQHLQKNVTRGEIYQIIEARVKETFATIHEELKRMKLLSLCTNGIVLTGGGALLKGISLAAEDAFSLPARIGHPLGIYGLTEPLRSPLSPPAIGVFSPLFSRIDGAKELEPRPDGKRLTFSAFANSVWTRLREPFA